MAAACDAGATQCAAREDRRRKLHAGDVSCVQPAPMRSGRGAGRLGIGRNEEAQGRRGPVELRNDDTGIGTGHTRRKRRRAVARTAGARDAGQAACAIALASRAGGDRADRDVRVRKTLRFCRCPGGPGRSRIGVRIGTCVCDRYISHSRQEDGSRQEHARELRHGVFMRPAAKTIFDPGQDSFPGADRAPAGRRPATRPGTYWEPDGEPPPGGVPRYIIPGPMPRPGP